MNNIKFQKLEKINLRNDTKKYLVNAISSLVTINNNNPNNKIHLYFGAIKDYFGIMLSTDEISDEIYLTGPATMTFGKSTYNTELIESFANGEMDSIILSVEKSGDKFLEIFQKSHYVRFPVNLDLIDWFKAETEIFVETKHDYKKITLPYINSILDKNIKWINDLIFNKSEESIVLLRTTSHVICKDIVWKNDDPSEFYILVFPLKPIKNIRDLTSDDIPILEQMKQDVCEIAEKYAIPKEKLYMFFHYHPSYYQLHLHVCITEHPQLETKYLRHYYLDDVIDKLKTDSDYWKNATLKFELLSGTKLYKLLKDNKQSKIKY